MRLSRLTYSLGLAFLCYGFVIFLFGPCLTAMAETFGVSLGRLGLIFTLYSVGLIPAVLLSGYLAEVVGRRFMVLGVVLIMGIGSALFAAAPAVGRHPSFALALGVVVVLGLGGGGMEALTNIVVADDNQPEPAFALSLTHAFFAIGAVLGPLVVSGLLGAGRPWQLSFAAGAGLFALLFFVLLPQRMPRATEEPFPPVAALGLLRSRLVWVLLAMIGLYVGAEAGLAAWVSPLMEKTLGSPRDSAGLSVSVFWAMMIVGRLAVSPLAARLRPPPLLFVLSLGSAASALAVALAPSAAFCLVAAGASGLFMSGIFALVLADASRHFLERRGAVFGIILTGVGVGSMIFPALMGWVADAANLRAALLIPAGLMVVVTAGYLARWSQ